MDSRGNLYEEIGSEMLKNLETEGVIKKASVEGLVPLMPSEAESAKSMLLAERLAFYNKKIAETVLITPEQLEGKTMEEKLQIDDLSQTILTEPLTRNEREEMKKLSLDAYGKQGAWQKMLNKGELRPGTAYTNAGDQVNVKKLHHFTVNEIKLTMQKVITEREEAAKVAAAKRENERQAQQEAELKAKEATSEQKA